MRLPLCDLGCRCDLTTVQTVIDYKAVARVGGGYVQKETANRYLPFCSDLRLNPHSSPCSDAIALLIVSAIFERSLTSVPDRADFVHTSVSTRSTT